MLPTGLVSLCLGEPPCWGACLPATALLLAVLGASAVRCALRPRDPGESEKLLSPEESKSGRGTFQAGLERKARAEEP